MLFHLDNLLGDMWRFLVSGMQRRVNKNTVNPYIYTLIEYQHCFLLLYYRNLLRCSFKKSTTPPEQTVTITKATHCYSTNTTIVQMKAISALTQLLVLSNETLTVLDLKTLALVRTLKFKSITSFHLNENPLNEDPFTVEICAGSKKKILYIHLSEEHVKVVKEVSTSLTPSTLVMDGAHICFAMGFEYCMLDILSGEIQQLFAIDNPQQPLIIHRVSKVINFYIGNVPEICYVDLS